MFSLSKLIGRDFLVLIFKIMGRQIIKQPNGKYCVFSSIIDNILVYDAEPQEIIDFYVEEATEQIELNVKSVVEKLEKGERPYYSNTKSFDEVLSTIQQVHGKEEIKKIKKFME